MELGLAGCSSAVRGDVAINDGVAPASGSVKCSLAEWGNLTINEGVVPPLLLLNFNFLWCGRARSGSSKDDDLRLVRRVTGAMDVH